MKKKKHHHKGRRNANAGGASIGPRPRSARLPKRAAPPPWKTILAAVGGGAGGAALGGLMVNQNILSEEAVGIGMMLGGATTAYFADGAARVVGASVAAAGAGQFALTLMNKRAVKGQGKDQPQHPQMAIAPAQPQLPAPPPVPPPRRSATGGGVVVDLFRDAITDLDAVDDEWRYGIRDRYDDDEPRDASEPVVIDLDEAA